MKISDNHIILNSNEILNQYCNPLFTGLDIIAFSYNRIFKDNTGFVLDSVSPLLTLGYITNELYPSYQEAESYLQLSKYGLLASDLIPNPLHLSNKKKWQENVAFTQSFNINSRFCILEEHQGYISVYCFSCDMKNEKTIQYYLENLPILEKFISYFKVVAYNLLADCSKHSIKLKFTLREISDAKISSHHNKNTLINDLDALILSNSQNKSLIINDIKITASEKRCLNLINKGMTSKEVARELNISYRTVEQHITNIKNKFSCKYTKQLLYLLKDNEFLLL